MAYLSRPPMLMLGVLAASSVPLSAQTYDRIAPKTPPTAPAPTLPAAPPADAPADDRVFVSALKGLVFVGDISAVSTAGASTEGIRVDNVPVLAGPEFASRMSRYLGSAVSFRALSEITREVVLYCRRHDRPIVDVFVPEQNVSSGTILIVVTEGRLGRLSAEGNRWFDSGRIVAPVRLRAGEVIAGEPLLEDVAWLNQNPFRQVDLVFSRGSQPGETDVILRTKDRRPVRVYAGYEDTGNDLTGDERIFAGVNWGNAFGREHLFNYQFTTSPDLEKLTAHSASYTTPLPRWRHTLTVFGSYAESEPELPGGFFTLTGRTWQVSARYRVPLKPFAGITHDVSAGLDFKRSNNDLAFGGTQVFAQETDVVQAVLAYSAMRPDALGATSLGLTLALSPGGLGDGNHTRRYRASRSGSRPDYAYGRLTAGRTTRLPHDFAWVVRGTAQLSSANLLASEQLGLGGYDSVRGYEEREANGDNGFILSSELQGPPLRLASRMRVRGGDDRFVPLVFIDYGLVKSHQRLPAEPEHVEMAGAGIGFRYQLSQYLTARFDYGWQLHDSGVSDGRHNHRGHIGITLAF